MAGNYIRTVEHRQKMSEKFKGRAVTWGKKIGDSKRGVSPKIKPTWDRTGTSNPCWRGGHKEKRICKLCGKEFEARKDDIKRGYGLYCSNVCLGIDWQIKQCREPTDIEIKLKIILDRFSIRYETQFIVDYLGIADFYIPSAKLIIEADGDYYHEIEDRKFRAKRRDRKLKLKGYKILRFKGKRIINRPEAVFQRIKKEIANANA